MLKTAASRRAPSDQPTARRSQLVPQLADGARALSDDIVRVDRLEVDLLREDEVRVCQLRILVERAFQGDAHRVLDEAGLEMGVLDDEQLVGPLEQLVDGRAHRALDDPDEIDGVDRLLRAHE